MIKEEKVIQLVDRLDKRAYESEILSGEEVKREEYVQKLRAELEGLAE